MTATTTSANPMLMMEHAENTLGVPPLVNPGVLLDFCQAVQRYGESIGAQDEVAAKVRVLQATLGDLRNLGVMSRFATLGHPHSFARVLDEMYCISVDFPTGPLEIDRDGEFCEDELDSRVDLTAALDLFAGASFVSKDDRAQRDAFVLSLVRAIEAAIAFPVTYSVEASTFIGKGTGEISPLHASIVIANATRRLLQGDYLCIPRAPRDLRGRLEHMARHWMRSNPVTTFFDVVSGPQLRRIVHWEDPTRTQPDDAHVGDPVTLLLDRHRRRGDEAGSQTGGATSSMRGNDGKLAATAASMTATSPMGAMAFSDSTTMQDQVDAYGDPCGDDLRGLSVMFCPHQPAVVLRLVQDGLEVRVPEGAVTGPIAVVHSKPDFTKVGAVIDDYFRRYPTEMNASIFGMVRMDMWAWPFAFGRPILEIMASKDRQPNQPSPQSPPKIANPATPPPNTRPTPGKQPSRGVAP